MAFNYSMYNYVDLVPAFSEVVQRNRLLQTLGIFKKVPSDHVKIAVDRLIEDTRSLINAPTSRYGSDYNTTARGSYSSYLIELPSFSRVDSISAQDFQAGIRKFGTDSEETYTSLLADTIQKHADAHAATVEQYYSAALFKGTLNTPYTQDKLIDYNDSFDRDFLTGTIDLTDQSLDVLESINGFVDQINAAAGGLFSKINRIVVFCGAQAYNKLRFSPSMKSYFQYVSPLDSGNVVVQRREILGNVSTFSAPGMSVDFVKCEDVELTDNIAANEMVFVPLFDQSVGAYQHIYGPSSRNTYLARDAGPAEVFNYTTESDLGEMTIHFESSLLPVVHATGCIMKVTVTV
ncbi:major capsid protein [Pantoea sp. Taur]|uniref:major capsid protein n=1 Tax=Pantoea sp. Taur TaxID=2576757 RepID=UPI0013551551|nr:major capsid protein [Pantoea sp. Taur]MXP59552.1 hypothetical protein [Pantoea sp. Taur]